MTINLRERQGPLKERYKEDPTSARMVNSVHSVPVLDDPMHSRIAAGDQTWDIHAHAMAGGPDGEICSGDVLLAALAGCQEITVKMVAAAMGIVLEDLQVKVTGEMDFRGTMGIDREVKVGYSRIVCELRVRAQGDPARVRRMVEKAEQFCVVRDSLAQGVRVESQIVVEAPEAASAAL